MVRLFYILVFCFNFLFSIENEHLSSKIFNLVGEHIYYKNKSFINKIFAKEDNFYKNGNLDIYKIIYTLKENGLIRLKFDSPKDFNIIFVSQTSPIFLLRSINSSLSYMGYSYFTANEASYYNDISNIRISLLTEHIVDPVALLDELLKHGFIGIDVKQNSNLEWEYQLLLTNSKVPYAKFISKGNSISLKDISGEYWLELSDSKGRLEIAKSNGSSFNPKIVFFDKNLNVLDVQILSKRSNVNIKIVDNTKFIEIVDFVYINNLKNGVNVKFK